MDMISRAPSGACSPIRPPPTCIFIMPRRAAMPPGSTGHSAGAALHRLAADDFLHLAGQLLQAERLGEEVDVAVAAEALAERILGVPGDEDNLHVGIGLAHLAD